MSEPHTNFRTIQRRRDVLTITLSGIFLFGIILGGWLPRSCPLLRQWIASCPSTSVSTAQTPEERELQRVPHQTIDRDLVEFTTKSQEYRGTTEVKFTYRPDRNHHRAYLGIRVKNHQRQLALITHPLLSKLTWQRYSVVQPNITLYQRTERYPDIDHIQTSLPPAQELAVDSIIAELWKLDPRQYTLLDSLTSLDGINYIVTSYTPPLPDGSWLHYSQTFDTSDAYVNADTNMEWRIYVPDANKGSVPFLMSSVAIDYKTIR